MSIDNDEERMLKSVAWQNAQSILHARQRAEEELIKAKEALELKTEELRDETRILELLNLTGTAIASELDLHTLVQKVTDLATQLSKAQFGAFFYATTDDKGETMLLYTLSGAPREAFGKYGHPRPTALFGPTFKGEDPVRCDDVLADPRYGQMSPHFGMPKGHPPVRSYLAVPVVSRSGEVLGGLFFGHAAPAIFSARTERAIVGVAGQAAVAIDNARLYEGAQKEIAERKLAEEALHESGERLRAAIAATGTGTFRWDIRTDSIMGDEAMNTLFGLPPLRTVYSLEDFIERVHPNDRDPLTDLINQCVESKSDFDMEFRVVWPDGSVHWLDDKAKMFYDEDGAPLYMTGACIDVTARKQSSEELQRARDEAIRASRAKSTFLANMSHELRTPLNAIIGYSEMLQDQIMENDMENVIADLNRIKYAGSHLLSLITDILDHSKIEAGKMELYISRVEVCNLLQDVAGTTRTMVEANSNTMTVLCHPDVGSIITDETKVKQILYNLISNAAKFTENGSINVDVSRDIDNGRDWINFKISDTGIGMEENGMAALFRDFTQIDNSTTRRHGGTGLGLSISMRFCKMMGGDITVTSQPGVGSCFTARLPASTKSGNIT